MNRRASPAVALAALAFALAASPRALAEDPKLTVELKPKSAEVTVGDSIELEVTVKNVGKDPAELTELVFDRQSVSFELKLGEGKTFKDEQMHDSVFVPKKYEKKSLKAGEAWTKTFAVPAVQAGDLEVTAVYGGGGKQLGSDPKKVKVKPTKDGATELVAKIRTNLGPLTVKFLPNDALGTVISFVRLAKDGFYDGKTFHRVVRTSNMGVIQGGDPAGNGSGGPGYTIPAELNEQKHTVGRLSMARRGDSVDSAGSQFFIVTKDTTHLDKNYTVFGEVTKGLDVLAALGDVKIEGGKEDGPPADKIFMETVRIEPAPKE